MSGSHRHPAQELRIVVRIQAPDCGTVPAAFDGWKVEMKNRAWVMPRRFVLMRVQERRLDKGDKHRQREHGRLIRPHHLSFISQNFRLGSSPRRSQRGQVLPPLLRADRFINGLMTASRTIPDRRRFHTRRDEVSRDLEQSSSCIPSAGVARPHPCDRRFSHLPKGSRLCPICRKLHIPSGLSA
jgi:hypothetical protein